MDNIRNNYSGNSGTSGSGSDESITNRHKSNKNHKRGSGSQMKRTRQVRSGISSGQSGRSNRNRSNSDDSFESTKGTKNYDTRPSNSGNGDTQFDNFPWNQERIASNNRPKTPNANNGTKQADITLSSITKRLLTPNKNVTDPNDLNNERNGAKSRTPRFLRVEMDNDTARRVKK